MSAASAEVIRNLPLDEGRGSASMAIFIVSEAMVFIALFFSYFYFAYHSPRWPPDAPPKLPLAFGMLGDLILGSLVLEWGRAALRGGRRLAPRLALAVTALLGGVYIVLQTFEDLNHLQTLHPSQDAYGSIFYTITTVHGAHLVVAILMLLYALVLPRLEPAPRPPHRSYGNVAMYWHFITIVWLATVCIMYLPPNL